MAVKDTKRTTGPGPCVWNGNEIVREAEPTTGIAGLAPDAPDEWGPLFAAAPEMYASLEVFATDYTYTTPGGTINCKFCDNNMDHLGTYENMHSHACPVPKAKQVLAKARGGAS